MRLLRALLPNLTIALNIAFVIVVYLDLRNPMMGFLVGVPFVLLSALCAGCSIATAVILYRDWRRGPGETGKKKDPINSTKNIE